MERAGSNNKEINYLELNINITTEGLEISVYNKTDDCSSLEERQATTHQRGVQSCLYMPRSKNCPGKLILQDTVGSALKKRKSEPNRTHDT
jgi:hypothetical protein